MGTGDSLPTPNFIKKNCSGDWSFFPKIRNFRDFELGNIRNPSTKQKFVRIA